MRRAKPVYYDIAAAVRRRRQFLREMDKLFRFREKNSLAEGTSGSCPPDHERPADLALAADFGVFHVGQKNLSPESVRRLIGASRWIGVSTHNPEQLAAANAALARFSAGRLSRRRPGIRHNQ